MSRLPLTIVFALVASIASAAGLEPFGIAPDRFVADFNRAAEATDIGPATVDECEFAADVCQALSLGGGVVEGRLATRDNDRDIEGISFYTEASVEADSVFFAALGITIQVLAAEDSTEQQRQAALEKIVREITAGASKVGETVGRFEFVVRTSTSGTLADVHVAADFNQLQRLFSP